MVKRIWLAEDDPDDSDLFVEAITEIDKSIICVVARNGKELIKRLNSEKSDFPDLIFLDINMPEMNGWDCLSYLKKNVAFENIPVIIYSTSSSTKNARNAIELGAFCFYEKPNNYQLFKRFLEIIAKSDLNETAMIKLAADGKQRAFFN